MKTNNHFKRVLKTSFALALLMLCGNLTFAGSGWRGVPFALTNTENIWGGYYDGDDDKGEPTRAVYMTHTESSSSFYAAYCHKKRYSITQVLYTPSDFDQGTGLLSTIAFYVPSGATGEVSSCDVKIYLANTTVTKMTGNEIKSATLVYDRNITIGRTSAGWDNLTFNVVASGTDYENKKFTYKGGNIIVVIVKNASGISESDQPVLKWQCSSSRDANKATYNTETSAVTFGSNYSYEETYVPSIRFTWEPANVETPTFSLATGTYNSPQSVTMSSATAGATIYYTTDGSTPTTSSSVYSGAITVDQNTTLKAIATKSGMPDSEVATASYTFKPAAPTASVASGVYISAQSVALVAPANPVAPNAPVVHYTTDGSTPTASSPVYSSPISVSTSTTIKAIAVTDKAGWVSESEVAEFHYAFIPSGEYTIDDRISHDLEYYGSTSLVHSSATPIDITVTYDGNGGQLGRDVQVSRLIQQKTLEQEDGAYKYTLMPSFSKRKVENGQGCAFLGWKLTSLSGGTIGYAVNDVIPAETVLTLTITGSNGMSIGLTAEWGAAGTIHVFHAGTVADLRDALSKANNNSTELDDNGTVETNFIVLEGDENAFEGDVSVSDQIKATITHIDPVTGIDYRESSAPLACTTIDCQNDTRFEYVTMSNITRIRGNSHNLAFGRGVAKSASADYCAKVISLADTAISAAKSTADVLNCRLLVETGVYDSCYVLSSEMYSTENNVPYVLTYSSNNNKISVTFGNDFDRVLGNNTSLAINGMVSLTNSYKFSGTGNVFTVTVKSGTFSSTANHEEPFYMGFKNASESYGKRYLTVEGGVLNRGISGGIDKNTSTEAFVLRMTGGTVNGPVYGAGTYTSAEGHRRMVLTGGYVRGWIAGGCNGTRTTGGELTGDTYLYIGGDVRVNTSEMYGSSVGGYVFGAGSGIEGGTTVGKVSNSNVVIADNAYIERDVYGGGNYGYVASGGTAHVQVLGGSIAGSVFGGSNQHDGATVDVSIVGGSVAGNVYGGSNTSGAVGTATVAINGGNIAGNVFGAGCGDDTDMGSATVNIGGGVVGGSVFGGGEHGESHARTVVNISGGTINGNAFAGALGDNDVLVFGNKTLNMTGGTVHGSVYGGSRNANDGEVTYTTNNKQVGDGLSYTTGAPFGTMNSNDYSWSESIYLRSEIGSDKRKITSIGYKCKTAAEHECSSLKIYMAHTSESVFASKTSWTPEDSLKLVYSHYGDVIGTTADKVQYFDLDVPFYYDGSRNLVVVVVRSGEITSGNGPAYYSLGSGGSYLILNRRSDNSYYASYSSTIEGTLSSWRPNLYIKSSTYTSGGTSSFVNIAGGTVANNVYGGGFYGSIDGNTYVNIGKNAIVNSPCAINNTDKPVGITAGAINIGGSVYSGSDWGEMAGTAGFGASNITGHTDIYIDGTDHSSINAGTALYGAGTSSFAGAAGSNIYVRNYGTSGGAKTFTTIQHATNLVIDNSNINFTGEGDQEQNNVSEPYAVRYVAKRMRLVNGSTISLNAPIEQVAKLGSYTCTNEYGIYAENPTYSATSCSDPGNTINMASGEGVTGHYINVVDTTAAATYGEVAGYFNFGGNLQSGTSFAYARQKNATASPCMSGYDHPSDGGFVSTYGNYNTYTDAGATTGAGVQICYINHPHSKSTPNYYREWVLKSESTGTEVEGTLIAAVNSSMSASTMRTVSTTMMIPSAEGSYFVLTNIDFGDEAGLVETGQYYNGSGSYAYRDGSNFHYDGTTSTSAVASAIALMDEDVNTRFGLTMTPKSGYNPSTTDLITWIINADALEKYNTNKKITLQDNSEEVFAVDFTLTYRNSIDINAELSPVVVELTEYNSSDAVVNKVYVKLNIITKTSVLQDTELDVYITQNGRGGDVESSVASVLLPPFVMTGSATTCTFTVTSIAVTPETGYTGFDNYCSSTVTGLDRVAIQYGAIPNSDQTSYWTGSSAQYTGSASHEKCEFSSSQIIGAEDGRFASTIGFVVSYDGTAEGSGDPVKLGEVLFTIRLDNYTEGGDNNFTVKLNIYRRSSIQNWYVSHEGNSFNSGHYPDKPKRSMFNILSSGYAAGDKVFVVNTVRVSSQQEWDGLSYGGINIYRYTGSHPKSTSTTENPVIDAAVAYTGPLVHVLEGGDLQMSGVTIDGMATGSPSYNVAGINQNTTYSITNGVASVGPAILVDADSRIEFYDGTIAYNNNTLDHNVETVGGIKMLGSMTVGGDVQINNNMAHGIEGNIYLPSYGKYLEVSAEGLDATASIGITKLDFDGKAFTPIANSSAATAAAVYSQDNFFADNGLGQLYYDNVDNATNNTQKEKDYLAMSWVSHVQGPPSGFSATSIDSPEDLAWAISYVNGYNGQEAQPNTAITITADIDMGNYIWVPIGDRYSPYAGTFTGNAKVIDNLNSAINRIGAKGLFGYTDGATISGAFVKNGTLSLTDDDASVGGIVGNANATTLDFCQSGLTTSAANGNAGGLVGSMTSTTTVRNSMAVGTVEGVTAGGVVGTAATGGTIANSFANADVEGTTYTGGIAGNNAATITNNYVHFGASITGTGTDVIAGNNTGSISSYVSVTGTSYTQYTHPAAYDYANQGGNKVGSTRLATQMNTSGSGYLPWAYTTASAINGDMPVLRKTGFTCIGQAAGTSRFIDYGTDVNDMIALYNANDGGGTINLTANANISTLPNSDVTLYINEDVAVTQSVSGAINAFTGITMKSGDGLALGEMNRTWHYFSSPLQNAPTGFVYSDETQHNPYDESNPEESGTVYPHLGHISSSLNGYVPNDMDYTVDGSTVSNGYYMDFDLYSFFEPAYHWINLKRNGASHYHQDGSHDHINYTGGGGDNTNETTFTPGKGYMFAIGDNSHNEVFIQSNGILNNNIDDAITVPITRAGEHLTGYNFLGNPYQSYLDFVAFANENKYIWSDDSHKGYIIYDGARSGFVCFGYDPTGQYPSQGSMTADMYINMHQGFMVISDGVANEAVFKNTMRANNQTPHFRDEQPTFPVVNLIVTDAEGLNDITVVEVNRPVDGGVRKLTELRNGDATMYVHYNNADLGLAFIEGTPEYVPLWFKAAEDGVFTMTWSTANANFGYLHLVDNQTGVDYDMLTNDHYTFVASTTDAKARFRLVFSALGIGEEPATEQGENFAFVSGDELVVNGTGELSLIDLNGRVLATQHVSGQQTHIAIPRVAVGMYMLRLSNATGTKIQKIVIRK